MVVMRSARRPAPLRSGFTTIELVATLVILGVVAAAGYPSVAQQLSHTRVNQAVRVAAADLEVAASLAIRDRRPVVFEGEATGYVIRDRETGAVHLRRTLGSATDWKIETIRYEPDVVEFNPSGLASSPLRILMKNGTYLRQVYMTRAGYVRVVP